jgi:hypothetical protein
LGKVVDWIKSHVFYAVTSDFMHEVAAGFLHVGRGYGCIDNRQTPLCLSCRVTRESVFHIMVECPAFEHIRRWASTAVEAVTTYRLRGRPLARLLAFGYDTTTLQHYAVGAIREAVMEAIRRTRTFCDTLVLGCHRMYVWLVQLYVVFAVQIPILLPGHLK